MQSDQRTGETGGHGRWRAMDIRQIEFVDAVARHGNFTRAANELPIAQPAVRPRFGVLRTSSASVSSSVRAGMSPSRTQARRSSLAHDA